jgi:hypothetical protein
VEPDGTMRVPTGPGIGVTVLEKLIRKLAVQTKQYRPARKTAAMAKEPAKATKASAVKRAARPSAGRTRAARPRSRR